MAVQLAIENRHALPVEMALRDPLLRSLHTTWTKHYYTGKESWQEIQAILHRAAAGMSVVEINASRNSGKLDYGKYADTGLNVIAVGGNSLSRGFTLEGLTVSYFLRNTQMYDTLLQMGRWFGYRDGYRDLCRLFLRPEASDWYGFIADATEELRDEIRRMELNGLTPMDFGLAVRSHPGTLLVTARDKMRNAEQIVRAISLSGKLVETSVLIASEITRTRNINAVTNLVEKMLASPSASHSEVGMGRLPNHLFSGVSADLILDFVSSFGTHPGQLEVQTAPLTTFIRDRNFDSWDVVLVSSSEEDAVTTRIHGLELGYQTRTVKPGGSARFGSALLVSGTKRRVASRGLERIGLSEQERAAAVTGHGGSTKNIPDHVYRSHRTRPLLMLHVLQTKTQGEQHEDKGIHAAYGLSFPGLDPGTKEKLVSYTANVIAYRELYGALEQETDDENEFDDN